MEQTNTTTETTQQFEPCWAIIEVFGHQSYAGKLSEQLIAGDKMLRLDIPGQPERRQTERGAYHPDPTQPGTGIAPSGHYWEWENVYPPVHGFTKLFGVKAIYSITPTGEEQVQQALFSNLRATHIENVKLVPRQPKAVIEAAAVEPPDPKTAKSDDWLRQAAGVLRHGDRRICDE